MNHTFAFDEQNTIYVWADGSWVCWDDAYHEIMYNPEYLQVDIPNYCTDLDSFAKNFAEENKDNFPKEFYDED